jgi:hypothetical protein
MILKNIENLIDILEVKKRKFFDQINWIFLNRIGFIMFIYVSGVKHIDKKDGAGKGNWGTPEDELAAQLIYFYL